MTLQEWIEENKNKEIYIQEDGTIKVIEPEPKKFPVENDVYFCINEEGCIKSYVWNQGIIDKNILRLGNVFKSKKEAERMLHRLKARKKFLDAGGHEGLRSGDNLACAWYPYLAPINKKHIRCTSQIYNFAFQIWFETEEACQKAIDSLADEEVKALCYIGE